MMEIYQNFDQIPEHLTNCVVALGNFDGVHIGHREVIQSGINESNELGQNFILLTFAPNPNRFFNPEFRYIHTPELRYKMFEKIGIPHCLEFDFDDKFSKISATKFIELLYKKLKPAKVITGFNFTFGHKKEGNRDTLETLANKYNFAYKPIEEIRFNSHTVSSTYIREQISRGRVGLVSKLLGSFFTLSGKVSKGSGEATNQLDTPTANIDIDFDLVIVPLHGVYFVKVTIRDQTQYGLAFVGNNPTFKRNSIQLEVHILDFEENILDQEVDIQFISLLRLERNFKTNEQIKKQIAKDKNIARYLLRNLNSLHSVFALSDPTVS